jgi:hypothetical protein
LIEEDEGPTPPELARIPVAPTLTDFQLPTFRTMIEQNKSVTAVEQDAYVQTAVANLPFAQGLDKPPGLDLPRGQLRRLIAQPGSLRQAIMLNEVLGPARAFTLDSAQFSVGRSVG